MLKTSAVNAMSYVTAWAQLQYFRVQPRDVKVHEGGEVTMQCEVANRAGFVQWTKDGFALGKFLQISYHHFFYLNSSWKDFNVLDFQPRLELISWRVLSILKGSNSTIANKDSKE